MNMDTTAEATIRDVCWSLVRSGNWQLSCEVNEGRIDLVYFDGQSCNSKKKNVRAQRRQGCSQPGSTTGQAEGD